MTFPEIQDVHIITVINRMKEMMFYLVPFLVIVIFAIIIYFATEDQKNLRTTQNRRRTIKKAFLIFLCILSAMFSAILLYIAIFYSRQIDLWGIFLSIWALAFVFLFWYKIKIITWNERKTKGIEKSLSVFEKIIMHWVGPAYAIIFMLAVIMVLGTKLYLLISSFMGHPLHPH